MLVGLVILSVVGLDLGEVFEEDSLSVGVLELGGIDDSILDLPGLEKGDLGALVLAEDQGCGADEGDEDCKLLSVHEFFM